MIPAMIGMQRITLLLCNPNNSLHYLAGIELFSMIVFTQVN